MIVEGAAPRTDWLYRFHLGDASVQGVGAADVRRGASRRARWAAVLLRLPAGGEAVPVRVGIARSPGWESELWGRQFGSRRLMTRQVRSGQSVRERKGPLELRMRVDCEGPALEIATVGAYLGLGRLRIPLPRPVAPQVTARAWADPPGFRFFRFDVRISVPVVGLLLSYTGYLAEGPDQLRNLDGGGQ